MSVWLALPSKRRPDEVEKVLSVWRSMGYRIAVRRDYGDSYMETKPDLLMVGDESGYPGYAVSMNKLCHQIIEADSEAAWIVAAGDDTLPDPNKRSEEIAEGCNWHFGSRRSAVVCGDCDSRGVMPKSHTFGVMQPTGDRWGEGQGGFANAPIDRVAGSPWIGREFALRMYGGAGPYWHEYRHMFVDEELQSVAEKLGVFWQRPDLTQLHNHWGRPRPGENMAPSERMPAFLAEANSGEHWRKYKRIFTERKAQNFPGHEPIP